ncbi:hypothetical protein ACLKOZ_20065 [Arthrobacter sp. R4]
MKAPDPVSVLAGILVVVAVLVVMIMMMTVTAGTARSQQFRAN